MIIGELINSSRKAIKPLVENYDGETLLQIARAEVEAGADFIDLNCGTFVKDEPERLVWLTKLISEELSAPICLDSPNPAALKAALPLIQTPVVINSISAESKRYQEILSLALEYGAKLIALCLDGKAVPQTVEDRYAVGAKLIEDLVHAGVASDNIYVDPLVEPVSVVQTGGQVLLETVRRLHQAYPEVHFICGLSNISFGLPNRKLINRYFLAQTIGAGMDSFILDPTDRALMGCYLASRMLTGQDKFCTQYLKANRRGLFND